MVPFLTSISHFHFFFLSPVIIQWSVFALRNILHNNAENQEFVKGVSKRGGPMPIDLSKIM